MLANGFSLQPKASKQLMVTASKKSKTSQSVWRSIFKIYLRTTKIWFYWILLFKAHHLQIRALDEDGINIVWSKFRNLCVVFLKNGQIHLHYSTISLYILQMILQMIMHQLFPEIPQTQFGFTKDRGTRNAIFVLRMLSERDIQHQDLFFVFIDCQKAFENRHAELSKMLLNTNIDKDKWSVRSAHSDQFTPVRLSEGKTNWFHVRGGVPQGCALSPDHFNLWNDPQRSSERDGD